MTPDAEDIVGPTCQCGKPGIKGAECPYAAEIHDKTQVCECCSACQRQCAEDI